MKVKSWQYILFLYVGMVVVNLAHVIYAVHQGERGIPFGWFAELLAAMVQCFVDVFLAYVISMIIDPLLKKIFENTVWVNLIASIFLYRILSMIIRYYNIGTL